MAQRKFFGFGFKLRGSAEFRIANWQQDNVASTATQIAGSLLLPIAQRYSTHTVGGARCGGDAITRECIFGGVSTTAEHNGQETWYKTPRTWPQFIMAIGLEKMAEDDELAQLQLDSRLCSRCFQRVSGKLRRLLRKATAPT